MKAGIEVLAQRRRAALAGARRHGASSASSADASARARSARFARNHGIERLFAIGTLLALAVEAFGPRRASGSRDIEALVAARSMPSSTRERGVLVKGSRVNRLERVSRRSSHRRTGASA